MIELFKIYSYNPPDGDWDLIRVTGRYPQTWELSLIKGYEYKREIREKYLMYEYELLACKGPERLKCWSNIQSGTKIIYTFSESSSYAKELKIVPEEDLPLYIDYTWADPEFEDLFKEMQIHGY